LYYTCAYEKRGRRVSGPCGANPKIGRSTAKHNVGRACKLNLGVIMRPCVELQCVCSFCLCWWPLLWQLP